MTTQATSLSRAGRTTAEGLVREQFRIVACAIAEHDAVRDDLDMAKQAGWIPLTPAYIIRMRAGRRRERKATAARMHAVRAA